METSPFYRPSLSEGSAVSEITHYLVSRVGTFVLCGVLATLGCKGPREQSANRHQQSPPQNSATDRADAESSERQQEREDERLLFRND